MPIIHANRDEITTLQGAEHGATISLILNHSRPGEGPRLHRHPYDETWVVQQGTITFRLGNSTLHAGPGDVVVAP
ncbi:MAG: cupin domain-containing protein, partial [Solirubrobacterales bacterium]|nr:cupin domain-containing protein [Solirubrobacterales bacterium]